MQDLKNQYYYEDNIDMLWDSIQSDSLKHDFYRQLKFITDKRWEGDEVNEMPFSESYPQFAVMNKQQFIFYFYYRTQMLKHNYMIPMHISYIYVFVYEILTGVEEIEVDELKSLLNYLTDNIRKHFTLNLYGGGGDYALTSKIEKWKPNIFKVYEYKRNKVSPANVDTISFKKNDIRLWENVGNYNIEESVFIKSYNLMNDVCKVLNTIIENLENEFKPKNIDIIERMVGKLDKKLDFESYFHTSVWTNNSMQYFLPLECARIIFNYRQSEKVAIVDDYGNTLRQVFMNVDEIEINFAGYVLKSIEYWFRLNTHYKSKLNRPKIDISRPGIVSGSGKRKVRYYSADAKKREQQYQLLKMIPDILNIIDRTITKYISDNKLSFEKLYSNHRHDLLDKENIKDEISQAVTKRIELEIIDEKSLQAARNVLYENQNLLVVDDDVHNNQIEIREEANENSTLSILERELIDVLLRNGDIEAFEEKAMKNYVSLNMLIESINDKAIDEIGDYIIENNDGTLSIIREYNDICEKWVNKHE